MEKIAVVSGATGMDGSYECELLLEKGYKVVGLKRRSSTNNTYRLHNIINHHRFVLREFDITDPHSVGSIFNEYQPDLFFNFAAQSHVGTSFEQPVYTFMADAVGVLNCLESIRTLSPHTRFVTSSSSEMFGSNVDIINGRRVQNEETQFAPRSSYACAKIAAHNLCRLYRDAYDVFACTAISHNHTSARRTDTFFEMKVARWINQNKKYFQDRDSLGFTGDTIPYFYYKNKEVAKLRLGNLATFRDFSHSKDIVQGQYLIINHDYPDDFMLCSGHAISMEDMAEKLFEMSGVTNWRKFVYIDPALYRPAEVDYLCGSNEKAREVLGWSPKYDLDYICKDLLSGIVNNGVK